MNRPESKTRLTGKQCVGDALGQNHIERTGAELLTQRSPVVSGPPTWFMHVLATGKLAAQVAVLKHIFQPISLLATSP